MTSALPSPSTSIVQDSPLQTDSGELFIDKTTYRAQAFGNRVKFLILHYTSLNLTKSIQALTGEVSTHYLVSETPPVKIFQLADENIRTFHAGESYWKGLGNLNDISIGIEIVNLGYAGAAPTQESDFYPFPQEQIDQVVLLCQNICQRYRLPPTAILGHSDIAPGRKVDPGARFPWKYLYEKGIGAWPDPERVQALKETVDLNNIASIQEKFQTYGYKMPISGVKDTLTRKNVRAFQLHFRPQNFSGELDIETVAILEALLEKYPPQKLL